MPSPDRVLSLVLVSATIAFLFLMSNVAILGWGQQSYIFWILLALIMVYPELASEDKRQPRLSSIALPDSSTYQVPSPSLPAWNTVSGN